MGVLFKSHATSVISLIAYEEFKRRIRTGEIVPNDQIKDRMLSHNQWRPVDDVIIFHKISPISYPKGPHIVELEEANKADQQRQKAWKKKSAEAKIAQQREEEAGEKAHAKEEKLVRKFFQIKQSDEVAHYNYRFLIACGEKPLTHEEFAVRCIYMPFDDAPRFVRVSRRGKKWVLCRNAFIGDLCKTKTRYLKPDSDDVRLIITLAESVDLARMSEEEKILALDGDGWTLEIAQHSSYTYRYRWAPSCCTDERDLAEFLDLCEHLETLALPVTGID